MTHPQSGFTYEELVRNRRSRNAKRELQPPPVEDDKEVQLDAAGDWYYKDGLSYYEIFKAGPKVNGQDQFSFRTWLVDTTGEEVVARLEYAEGASEWTWIAQLGTGAQIGFRRQGDWMVSSYRSAEETEWRRPVSARRQLNHQAEYQKMPKGQSWAVRMKESVDGPKSAALREPMPEVRADKSKEPKLSGKAAVPEGLLKRLQSMVSDLMVDAGDAEDDSPLITKASGGALTAAIQRVGKQAAESGKRARAAKGGSVDQVSEVSQSLELREVTKHVEFGSKPMAEPAAPGAKALEKKNNPRDTIIPLNSMMLVEDMLHPLAFNEIYMLKIYLGEPHNSAYNLQSVFPIGFVSLPDLDRAVTLLIQRHAVLRSCFTFEDGDRNKPRRILSKEWLGKCSHYALMHDADPALINQMDQAMPFSLAVNGVRANLFGANTGNPMLGWDLHHIFLDAEGTMTLWQETSEILAAVSAGFTNEAMEEGILNQLPVQFIDFAYWQRALYNQGNLDPDIAYWYCMHTSACPPLVLDIPNDYPRPRVYVSQGTSARLNLPVDIIQTLLDAKMTTSYAVMIAAWTAVLCNASGLRALNMGCAFALRPHHTVVNLVGNFLNMMTMRVDYRPTMPFLTMLDSVARATINIQRYMLAPNTIVEEKVEANFRGRYDPSRPRMYQTQVDMVPNASDEGGTQALAGILDIFIFANTGDNKLKSIDCVYNTGLFSAQTASKLLLHLHSFCLAVGRNGETAVPRALPQREVVLCPDKWDGVLCEMIIRDKGGKPVAVELKNGFVFQTAGVSALLKTPIPDAGDSITGQAGHRFARHCGLHFATDAAIPIFDRSGKHLRKAAPPQDGRFGDGEFAGVFYTTEEWDAWEKEQKEIEEAQMEAEKPPRRVTTKPASRTADLQLPNTMEFEPEPPSTNVRIRHRDHSADGKEPVQVRPKSGYSVGLAVRAPANAPGPGRRGGSRPKRKSRP
eukprot:gnl/TRDRNA2_/TRDRNA2_183036_c0_seq1.p1 gnl/TRDRNA2_/TRDRNA2_183036_c0~~gnl/TRDRNA2_/TRDRNA2_183036_c0_seq1.p1  ORF type:complete len:967 (+),score=161.42 gnl/TRDRNA2_/TRDRNA2_183036_c0_seq1:69-2969(+)